jgi:hypothetical protein
VVIRRSLACSRQYRRVSSARYSVATGTCPASTAAAPARRRAICGHSTTTATIKASTPATPPATFPVPTIRSLAEPVNIHATPAAQASSATTMPIRAATFTAEIIGHAQVPGAPLRGTCAHRTGYGWTGLPATGGALPGALGAAPVPHQL